MISSYTPTLTTLLSPPPPAASQFKMVAVMQPDIPGQQSIPFTVSELTRIERRVPHLVKLGTPTLPSSVENVLNHLSDASIAHFACHGIQHPFNALNSALLLSGENLTVSTLMKHSMPYASLAFLSACETAKGDETVPDEAIHLAATMLFAGFRGVVGTMWLVSTSFFVGIVCQNCSHYVGLFLMMMLPMLQITFMGTYSVMGPHHNQTSPIQPWLCILL